MYQKPTHYTEQKKKKSKCKLDTLLVLSEKIYPSALWVTLVWSVPYVI